MQREVKILSKIQHLNIIKLYSIQESVHHLHLLMEYPNAEPLNNFIKHKNQRFLPESEAKTIFKQIVEAIKHCHKKCVVHRDVKLENILVSEQNIVKLIDFGFSIAIAPDTKLNIFCGTPSYMAPEIVNKQNYSFGVDIWALGIVLYKILNGVFPFKGTGLYFLSALLFYTSF